MQDQSSKSVACLPTREGAKRLLLHFGSRDGGKPKGREQRQGEAGGGGTEQVRVEVRVANSEQRHGGNGLVRLELRSVAAGVPVAVWQLASEGVHARECARTHGCKQMHPVSSNDQTVAAQRGGGRQRWRTTRRVRHIANGGARSGTACPAVGRSPSAEGTGCGAMRWGDGGEYWVSAPVCSPTRTCACGHRLSI
jgi:hypothetical protein